jgi:rhamnose utilization protein RhaD (predicted bifunctional aldolase and dehydrogenase)
MNPARPYDFNKLKQCSAIIGADRFLVQAAGGNTSVKQDGVMWIKASGTQLAQAMDRDIFVAVDLAAMASDIINQPHFADEPQRYLLQKNSLRPSIETSLHAVFKQRVVLHAHCVNTIAFAVQENAEALLAPRLKEFDWAFVPYAKPGAHLARSVQSVLQPQTNVVVLGNHGVLVTGENVADTHNLLTRVQAALATELPPHRQAESETLKQRAGANYDVLGQDDPIHQLAFSQTKVKQAIAGSLYPDHVTFCGIAAHALSGAETADSYCEKLGEQPVLIIVPEAGVLIRTGFSAASLALARCLSDVLARVPADARIQYLTQEQNWELLNWDAETYRQKLNA